MGGPPVPSALTVASTPVGDSKTALIFDATKREAAGRVLRGKSICIDGRGFEMPALAERSLRVAISGAEVCSALAKHKSGRPKMHRGPFASV